MHRHGTLSVSLELGCHTVGAIVAYHLIHGEPRILYDKNGTGYPGSPPDVELTAVWSISWDAGDGPRLRDNSWVWRALDEMVREELLADWQRYRDDCLDDAEEGDDW